ncbi:MAG: class I SAM-dependent methyltransferase [Steroidobacteraceae bacterium]
MSSSPRLLAFLASSPRGLSDLLRSELEALGAVDARDRSTGVAFRGTLETAYRACLGSRIANRVLLEIAQFQAADAEQFYREARMLDWTSHVGAGATIACGFTGRHPTITHTHFGALKLKDAVCDALREQAGFRPDVARERPSVRLHAHAQSARITLSIDLAGESLHRRGYRAGAGEAPLKENVAAGVLLRAGWDALARQGAPFLDPLCGSGTLAIEAAMIAAAMAPGRHRDYFGFLGWRGHDPALWQAVREAADREATERAVRMSRAQPPRICGRDRDARAIRMAQENAERAGVAALVRFEVGPLEDARPPSEPLDEPPDETRGADEAGGERHVLGLVCTNPPYGVRLADQESARQVHRELGRVLRERFQGWDAAVLTGAGGPTGGSGRNGGHGPTGAGAPASGGSPNGAGEPSGTGGFGRELGIRAHRTHALWNGAIECRLLRMRVAEESLREPGRLAKPGTDLAQTPGARMFANRLGKNVKRLRSWAERMGVSSFRLYDADMPEYAFAIDLYRTDDPQPLWLYVQEYAAPREIEPEAVRRRRGEVLATLPGVTGVPRERIRVRTRRKTRRGEQYEKVGERARTHVITEGGLEFEVNFDDYLDTGLFLDHRLTRAWLKERAAGRRFLNLFAYTGTATVYAAAGGAAATTSVDLSRTYLGVARSNLALNGFDAARHSLVQADCREWLRVGDRRDGPYDLIFLDPPTFSNSKRMQGVLDVERDHPELLDACARLLAPGGAILFSTNAQRFELEESVSRRYEVRDLSAATLPLDFERNPRIHRCFEIYPSRSLSR